MKLKIMIKKNQGFLEWIGQMCFPVILFFMGSSSLQGQTDKIIFDHLTSAQGLSQTSVTCIAQDKKGFMWFGTDEGLNRFDGYNFKIFLPEPDNKESLRDMRITALYVDHLGTLWIGTRNFGLHRYDREKESFFNYQNDSNNPNSLSHNAVTAISEDRNGRLWIGTEGGGLNIFDPEKSCFTRYVHDDKDPGSISGNVVHAIFQSLAGHIWIGTDNGLNQYDNGRFTHFIKDPGNANSLPHNSVYAINESEPGTLWLGTDGGGLCKFDTIHQRFITFMNNPKKPNSLSHDRIRSIYIDAAGKLWIGTWGGGLNLFDPKTEKFSVYTNQPGNPTSISDNSIFSIYEDRAGVMWISTITNGINKFSRERKKFKHYTSNPKDPNSLNNSVVFGITETPDGIVWIGTFSGGLNRFDRKTGVFTAFKHDPNNPNSISDNRIPDICIGQDGLLWIGTARGLSCFDPKKNIFTNYLHDPNNSNSLSHNRTFTVHQDRQGYVWIGTRGGLDRLDPKSKIFTHYRHDPRDPESLSQNSVYLIFEDKTNMFWVGTEDGLNRFDRQTGEFQVFRHDFNNVNSISNNGIYSICETRSGEFWIGSTGGLNRMDRATGTFTHFLISDGLPNNVIYGILEDNKGNLWLSTNNGLSRFDPKNRRFRNFTVKDGLQGTEFDGFSYFKNSRGEMYFGGINGFNIFLPEEITDNTIIPSVVLTDFKILNKSVPFGGKGAGENVILKKPISETDDIVLSYRDRTISFEFTVLDFIYPEKNLYACKMEGLETDWNYTDAKRRFRDYSSLHPGQYTFRVKGSNSDDVWNNDGVSLKITILPPFWGTWWFRSLGVLTLVVFILAVYQIRTRSIRERSRYLEMKVEERTAELHTSNEELQQEITERKQVEKALAQERNLLWALMDTVPDHIYFKDTDSRFIRISKAQVEWLGLSDPAQAVGKTDFDFFTEEHARPAYEDEQRIVRTGQPLVGIEERETWPDRPDTWVSTSKMPLRDEGGKIVGTFGISRDITERKRIEEALRESETLLRSTLESIEDGILVVNEKGKITHSNARFAEMWRVPKKIMAAKDNNVLLEFVKNQLKNPKEFLAKVRKLNETTEQDFDTLYFKDGRIFERLSFPLVIDKKDEGRVWSFRDATERTKAKEEIKRLKEFNEGIIQNMIGGIVVDNKAGRITFVNPAVMDILGYSYDELVGKPWKVLYPADQHSLIEKANKLRMRGKRSRYEVEMVHKNGQRIPILVSGSPYFDVGHYAGTIAVFMDITELKRAEKELEKRQQYLESVLHDTPNAIVTTDSSFRVSEWNPGAEKIFGYTREEVLGKNIDDLVVRSDIKEEALDLSRKHMSGEIFSLQETVRYRKDGTPVNVTIAGSPIRVGGDIIGSVGVYTDITQRKQAEEQIRASLQEKEILLKEIHHRVKNNFQVISSLLHLQSRYIQDKTTLNVFKESQNRIRSMALVHEKLYQSKNLAKVDFGGYIETLANGLFRSFGIDPKRISLVIKVRDIALGIDVAVPCGLIVNELISNSLKYGFPESWEGKGEIRIALSQKNGLVDLVVSDNGVGLPEGLDIRNTESLGLRLVTLLAEDQLQGKMTLGEKKGTQFHIQFKE